MLLNNTLLICYHNLYRAILQSLSLMYILSFAPKKEKTCMHLILKIAANLIIFFLQKHFAMCGTQALLNRFLTAISRHKKSRGEQPPRLPSTLILLVLNPCYQLERSEYHHFALRKVPDISRDKIICVHTFSRHALNNYIRNIK